MKLQIPSVSFELNADGSVLIEQDHGGDTHYVDLCPAHLQVLGDLLDRRMVPRVVHLRNRILALHEDLAGHVGYPGRVSIPEADDSEQLLALADLLLNELGVPPAPTDADELEPAANPGETQSLLPGLAGVAS